MTALRTLALRRQHDAALDLVKEIMTLTGTAAIEGMVAYRISLQLARLTGLLRIHFAQEDKALYPLMIGSSHRDAAALAERFQDEMGGLAPVYFGFAERWAASQVIAGDPDGFRRDCATVFGALGERVRRENEELYPLADNIAPDMIQSVA